VVSSLAPSIPGIQQPETQAPPGNLLPALLTQNDLRQVPGGEGFTVFENTRYVPARAQCARSQPAGSALLTGCSPVLPGPAGAESFSGQLATGPVYAAYAPSGRWSLAVDGRTIARTSAFGWAAQFPGTTAGPGRLSFNGTPLVPLSALLELLVWLALGVVVLGRRRWIAWWQLLSNPTGPSVHDELPPGGPR
jgi:hypothetical protein